MQSNTQNINYFFLGETLKHLFILFLIAFWIYVAASFIFFLTLKEMLSPLLFKSKTGTRVPCPRGQSGLFPDCTGENISYSCKSLLWTFPYHPWVLFIYVSSSSPLNPSLFFQSASLSSLLSSSSKSFISSITLYHSNNYYLCHGLLL